jgi:hypothetical protein
MLRCALADFLPKDGPTTPALVYGPSLLLGLGDIVARFWFSGSDFGCRTAVMADEPEIFSKRIGIKV